jgi:hypothetical protein
MNFLFSGSGLSNVMSAVSERDAISASGLILLPVNAWTVAADALIRSLTPSLRSEMNALVQAASICGHRYVRHAGCCPR